MSNILVTYSSGPAPRPKPKAGDRRTTKKHGLQIRVQDMATEPYSRKPIGRVVHYGRPMFSWIKPEHLKEWDRHHLTPAERAAAFPNETRLAA